MGRLEAADWCVMPLADARPRSLTPSRNRNPTQGRPLVSGHPKGADDVDKC